MIEGIWIDTMYYKGEDPEREVDCDVCNGTVHSKTEVQEIIDTLSEVVTDSEVTNRILGELESKLTCSLDCL